MNKEQTGKNLTVWRGRSMNENVIEFLKGAETATVTFCQGRYISKIKKLAEKFPDECEIVAESPGSSIMAHIPVKWIKINNASKTNKEYTEEEKQIMRKRLEIARKNRSKTDKNHLDDN